MSERDERPDEQTDEQPDQKRAGARHDETPSVPTPEPEAVRVPVPSYEQAPSLTGLVLEQEPASEAKAE
jgi:hypothetical protein